MRVDTSKLPYAGIILFRFKGYDLSLFQAPLVLLCKCKKKTETDVWFPYEKFKQSVPVNFLF